MNNLTTENEILRQSDAGHSLILCKKAKDAAKNVKIAASGAELNLQ